MGSTVGLVSSGIGLAGSLMGGGGDKGAMASPAYQPMAEKFMDSYYQPLFERGINNVGQQIDPLSSLYSSNYWDTVGNYFAPSMIDKAKDAGQYLTGTLSPQLQNSSTSLAGLGDYATPYARQILQTGFDPQNQIYDRNVQRLMDSQNAINSMSGVAMTPYGAGVTGQTLGNFNLDWENNLLNRMNTAATGYNTLTGNIANLYSGAGSLGNAAAQATTLGGQLPYMATQQYNNDVLSALNAYAGNQYRDLGATMGLFDPISNYLKLGQNASATNGQIAQANSGIIQANNATSSAAGQNFTDSLGGLATGIDNFGGTKMAGWLGF